MSQGTLYQTGQQHGKDTKSDDYHDYISNLSRMLSVHPGAPQYPTVHKAFNSNVIQEEEVRQDYLVNEKNPTKSPKKVQVTEEVQVMEQDGNQKSEVLEENVDNEADGFIKKKHNKGFQMCKWKTFKYP